MRSKYINTFDTTSEFENYIESAEPGFPNVAYTKDTGDVHYTSTSPNDHLIYGTLNDPTQAPAFKFNNYNNQTVTAHVNALDNTFYIDESDMSNVTTPITSLYNFINNNTNIISIKKFNIDTSNVTSMYSAFNGCSNIQSLNLANLDVSNVSNVNSIFNGCSSLVTLDLSGWDLHVNDTSWAFGSVRSLQTIYITEESTLMKLTNNLTSQGAPPYIPSSATIYYNDQVYKWQNNAWTLQ